MWFDTANTTYWASGASSATYTNWPVVTPDSGCLGCHNTNSGPFSSTTAPDEFTPWKDTAHATFFSRGLENITGNSSSCTTCHTAGSDLASSANNGGYDDMVGATGFVYTKGIGKWAAMSAPTSTYLPAARVANIQCENCHGPQTTSASPFTDPGAHGTTLVGATSSPTSTQALRVSYGAEVCAQCHASGTGHHIYSEWVASINPDTGKGHSKFSQLGTGTRATDGSCSRCHTAQGFATYVPQLVSGNAGTLPAGAITWNNTNAQVQTCQTCHDSHDATNPNQLRVYDKLTTTMAGFGVDGFGKGAVCVACHNSRNGIQCASAPTSTGSCASGLSASGATFLHEDSNTNGRTGVGNASDPDAYLDSMHDASQAEVLAGRDFFFMGNSLPMLSKHANVEDTCVGCHMKLNPQTHLSHGAPATSTHVWYIKDADVPTLCANCHSSSVDGVALQVFVEQQLAVLGTKMSTNFVNKINTALAVPTTVYLAKKQISSAASATYSDGSFYVTGTLTSGGTTTTLKVSLTTVTTDAAGTVPLILPSDILKKGNWNWMMIERDGSKGIHNPTLIQSVLVNTINQAW
jgi:formate-dependent nitrite reductase cytochrome c552 subunit